MPRPAISPSVEPLAVRLTQLLAQIASDSTRHNAADRAEPRHAVQLPVWLGLFRGPADVVGATTLTGPPEAFRPIYRGWATDLSPHGISLLVEQSLSPHTRLVVKLEALTHEPLHVPMRVVYCKQLLPHTHRVGGAFRFDLAQATPPTASL